MRFTDGSQLDLSSQAVWSSSDAQLAVVNGTGRLDALLPGVVSVTAQLGRFSASSVITVVPVSLSISTQHAGHRVGADE